MKEKPGKDRKRRRDLGEVGRRVFAATQVGQGPDGVPRHRQTRRPAQHLKQRRENALKGKEKTLGRLAMVAAHWKVKIEGYSIEDWSAVLRQPTGDCACTGLRLGGAVAEWSKPLLLGDKVNEYSKTQGNPAA